MNQRTPMRPIMPHGGNDNGAAQPHTRHDRELIALMLASLALLILLLVLFLPGAWQRANADAAAWDELHPNDRDQIDDDTLANPLDDPSDPSNTVGANAEGKHYMPVTTDETQIISESAIDATNAILVDLTSGEAVAQRLADERIYPASMTKIMTVLVACESLTTAELQTTFTMTEDIVSAAVNAGASRAGFEPGERVKLIDLLYGAALPSGADATAALAQYLAGSEEKYVALMNQRAEEIGLTQTHFVNASGLHDGDHYSTVREIAALMACAMDNPLCRQLLSAASYTTAATEQHPNGITLYSTTFSRMSTTTFGSVSVVAGKTGYTEEARFCLASLATRADGREYILVTVGGSSKYAPVYDCDAVYGKYLF